MRYSNFNTLRSSSIGVCLNLRFLYTLVWYPKIYLFQSMWSVYRNQHLDVLRHSLYTVFIYWCKPPTFHTITNIWHKWSNEVHGCPMSMAQVWIISCLSTSSGFINSLSQWLHLYGFNPLWNFSCFWTSNRLLKFFHIMDKFIMYLWADCIVAKLLILNMIMKRWDIRGKHIAKLSPSPSSTKLGWV